MILMNELGENSLLNLYIIVINLLCGFLLYLLKFIEDLLNIWF